MKHPVIHRRRLLQAALILGLGAAACPASAAPGDPAPLDLTKVQRIVTLGDSITQQGGRVGGYVWQIDHYLQALQPEHRIQVINAGISGHKSTDMLARFQRDVLDRKPDVVSISVGINDVWHGFTQQNPNGDGPRGVPLEEFRKNVEAMLQAAQKAGVQVVLFTTTIFEDQPASPRNMKVADYNAALRELAKKYGARLADQNAAFMAAWDRNMATGQRLTTDQVHMARPGDDLMARTALLALGVSEKELDRVRPEVVKNAPPK